ncbi:hypothetical protein OQA88_13161 [Cercophora sp. LCS_1]
MSSPTVAAESARRAAADTERGVTSAQVVPSPPPKSGPSTDDALTDQLTTLKIEEADSSDDLSEGTETPNELAAPNRNHDVIEQIMRSFRANLDLKLGQVASAVSTAKSKQSKETEAHDESSEADDNDSAREPAHLAETSTALSVDAKAKPQKGKSVEDAKKGSVPGSEEETLSTSVAAMPQVKAKKSASLFTSIRSPRRLFQKRAAFVQPGPSFDAQSEGIAPAGGSVSLASEVPPSAPSSATTSSPPGAPPPPPPGSKAPPPPPRAPVPTALQTTATPSEDTRIYPGLALASASALASTPSTSSFSASTRQPPKPPAPSARFRKASPATPSEAKSSARSSRRDGLQRREEASDSTALALETESFPEHSQPVQEQRRSSSSSAASAPAPPSNLRDYRPPAPASFRPPQVAMFPQPSASMGQIASFSGFSADRFGAAPPPRPIAPRAIVPPAAPAAPQLPDLHGGGGPMPFGNTSLAPSEEAEMALLLQNFINPNAGQFPGPANDPTSAISPLDLQQALLSASTMASPFMGMGLTFVQQGMSLPEVEPRHQSVSSPETPNRSGPVHQPVTPQSMGRAKHDQDWEEGVASDHDGRRKKQRRSVADKGGAGGSKKFACPYFKRNRRKYSKWTSCPGPGWDEVHRVKTHLYRRHALPIQCPRCWDIFKTEDALNAHLQHDVRCEVRENRSLVEGFTKDQEKKLRSRKKATADTTDEDKWREIYTILFPDDDPESTPTPYYDSTDYEPDDSASPRSGELEDYTTFVRREMPTLVRRELENLFDNEFQDIEAHLRPRVAEIVLKLQPKLLGLYKQSQMPLSEYGPPSNEPLPSGDQGLTPALSHRTGTDQGSTPTTDPYLAPSTDFTFDTGDVLNFDTTGLGLGGWEQPLPYDGDYVDAGFNWDNDFNHLLNPALILGGDKATVSGWEPQAHGQDGYRG